MSGSVNRDVKELLPDRLLRWRLTGLSTGEIGGGAFISVPNCRQGCLFRWHGFEDLLQLAVYKSVMIRLWATRRRPVCKAWQSKVNG